MLRRLAFISFMATTAFALDKQGSAHGGAVGGNDTSFNFSGALMAGVSLYNPSYAARPDNTGLALFRYAAHFDVDLIGRYLSVPLDVSFFTDATRMGGEVLLPTEFDFIGGITSTFAAGPGDLELGTRVEHDRPIDKGTFTQTYVDARARYLMSFGSLFPKLKDALKNGDVSGWATLGGFVFNPTYAARPDNSGLALFRYALHGEVSTFDDLLSLGLDATMFTDRTAPVWAAPSELDFTVELIFHWRSLEAHLAYERDMPLDRPGFVQQFVYLLAAWSFDLRGITSAFTDRHPVPSP
ncbi:MAG: hypothetical protein DI536_31385 [Archangium gephyra]|uniref:Uncharacterized protein n=1 Tax=Archangium gephyra TaxID=48 RepID=A0A2W5T3I6_9BACT|nr:MAG: hypothetical protein DI536_31385 [Archangium gephyra]